MSRRAPRWSWTTMWAAAIVILLPALAWLQYSWLDQIAAADRERRERTVRTAAAQLAQEFDLELAKALFALQVDNRPQDGPDTATYAARYASWSSSASNPRMVKAVYRATSPGESPAAASLQLQRWNAATEQFEIIEWPADMQALATSLREQLEQMGRRTFFRRGADGPPPPPFQPEDPALMVAPMVQVHVLDHGPNEPGRPTDVRVSGFTIVQLDLDVLTSDVLPAFVRRHFNDESGHSDFRVAVVGSDSDQRVLFESEPGAAAAALLQPDAAMPLMTSHGRPFMMIARADRGERSIGVTRRLETPPSPPDSRVVVNLLERRRDAAGNVETRVFGAEGAGHWRLVAKHRAGSLEAAVNAARTRNFALSSGILLLLSAAIGLIIVSARRADRLGRQQMEFVATVSHELRTPVSVIGAAAGNLADGVVNDPARVRHYGETIQSEARRLAETVERVLQLAGIASGRAVALETLSAAALVDDGLNASNAEIEAAGFDVEVDVPVQLPAISGDRAALRSAMQNLIGNALKYGRDGQWLRIGARATTMTSRGGRQAQQAVEIAVIDRGPGIPVEDRPHIFEAFYRGRHAVTHQIQGSGLGLHLVQRIVEAHGGQVTVDSEPGAGSRFTLTLPAAGAAAASEHSMSDESLHHDPTAGHALEPGRSH